MSILFTPSEVFEIAIEIERNGASFYRKAASSTSDSQARSELLELAAMEDGHEVTFTELKRDLVGDGGNIEWFDSASEAAMYLQNFASGQVFDMTQDPLTAASRPLPEILRFALERERDSVVFFVGMQELMPAGPGRTKVEAIIKQEMGHISLLGKRYQQAMGLA